MLVPGPIAWCATDARGRVVWFQKGEAKTLHAFDLVDRTVHDVIATDMENVTPAVVWKEERLGAEDALEYDVAAEIHLETKPPSLAIEMGCDGDRAWYCYEDDMETPNQEVAATIARGKSLTFADAAYLSAVALRGAGVSLPAVPTASTPPTAPVLDQARCEEGPNCGTLYAIPGSTLWLVETANSRGDFYHSSRELWDPATKQFVSVVAGKLARSAEPFGAGVDYERMLASNGRVMHQGAIFDASAVRYSPVDEFARSCGFATVNWHIAPATEP